MKQLGIIDSKENYSEAIEVWNELTRDTLDSEKWFYMGASYIMLEQIDSAHHYLEKVDFESFYFYKAQWYQALLYIKHNQKDKAEPLLETLESI